MKKNNGFTLIELLAVILILGIIALIAIPTVNSILKESRTGAWKSTASQMTKAAENYFQLKQIKNQVPILLSIFHQIYILCTYSINFFCIFIKFYSISDIFKQTQNMNFFA